MAYKATEVILTQKQLQKRLKYWQKVLRLQDWKLDVSISTIKEMDGFAADIRRIEAIKQAKIRVMGPNETQADHWVPLDMELLLVHELVHLHYETTHDKKRHEVVRIEQGVESISEALIALERK